MGTQGPMADPHMGWRRVREEVPCSKGQDGEEERKGKGKSEGPLRKGNVIIFPSG